MEGKNNTDGGNAKTEKSSKDDEACNEEMITRDRGKRQTDDPQALLLTEHSATMPLYSSA